MICLCPPPPPRAGSRPGPGSGMLFRFFQKASASREDAAAVPSPDHRVWSQKQLLPAACGYTAATVASVLEKVDEMLGGHRCETAVRVSCGAGVSRVLPE